MGREYTDQDTEPMDSIGNTLNEFRRRIETLESTSDDSQHNVSILMELIAIVAETRAGKLLINRAINRYKLHYLRDVVLPRRRQQVQDINCQDMPEPLQKEFLSKELRLVRSATNALRHREHYEAAAATACQRIRTRITAFKDMDKLFDPKRHKKLLATK